MLVTQGLTIMTAYRKKSLRCLVNIEQKKRMITLGTGTKGMKTEPQLTTQKMGWRENR